MSSPPLPRLTYVNWRPSGLQRMPADNETESGTGSIFARSPSIPRIAIYSGNNHPEFPAAHACLTGSLARTLELYFHTPHVRLTVNSSVTGTTHTFTDVRDLEDEVRRARIYAGFHYRHSLNEGRKLGHRVAEQSNREFFRPRQRDGW
jgi:hypothetical protein